MATTYDLKNVVCTIGGVAISGWGDDALSVEWDADLVEAKKTADGKTIYSRLNDRGLVATITVSQHSRSYFLLWGLCEAQHGDNAGIAPPIILPLPFMLIDPSNGETLSSLDTVFMSRPAPSKGKTAGDVQFKVHLPSPKHTPPALNVI